MYCRYCGSEMKGSSEHCKACGKDNYIYREPRKKLTPKQKRSIIAIVLAVVILIPTVFFGVKGVLYLTKENDLYFKDNYSVSANKIGKHANEVVAVSGSSKLTNAQLQVFYWMRAYDFLNTYNNDYVTINADFTKPLGDQICDTTTGITWEQYFLRDALNVWHRYSALAEAAEKEGYTLPEDAQSALDSLRTSAEEAAEKAGMDDLDAFIQTEMGPGVTFADYEACVKLSYMATSYYSHLTEKLLDEVTDADIEAHFVANEETLKNTYEITKDSGDLVAVRHILIEVAKSGKDDNDKAISTDADWENCRKKAQAILDEYRGGAASEERFSDLAKEYSEDPGSKDNGGLYSGIHSETTFVKPFLDWCMDESRSIGEVELVKTDYGYHVMYFVSREAGWIQYCRTGAANDKCSAMADGWMTDNPIETDFKKIALGEFVLS